jgi:four helix bundle protein
MELAVRVYEITQAFPKKEDYGVTSQLRRAALSVSANIAEAFGRYHRADKLNFYYSSRGSLTETLSHLIYCLRIGYIRDDRFKEVDLLIRNIWKELNRVIVTLRRRRTEA